MTDRILELDPANLRDWLAAVGLLRLISETAEDGALYWRLNNGRYRLVLETVSDNAVEAWSAWIAKHRGAWHFAGRQNVDFDGTYWRNQALTAQGIELALWCAIASDAVWHRNGKKLKASGLEYAHGGGHQHWLTSLGGFLGERSVAIAQLKRIISGAKEESMEGPICRWDPACERDHALRGKAPSKDPMTQDQTLNALSAIGLTSCPSAPGSRGLLTPLVRERGRIVWPLWTDRLRIADLEAALCCGWTWPTMQSRRWLSGKLYCFSRGELREPEAYQEFV